MIKTNVVRSAALPEFKAGELVELSPSKFDEKDLYIVIITGKGSSSTSFAGTIVHVNQEGVDRDHFVGHHSNSFTRDCFVKFTGTLELNQS